MVRDRPDQGGAGGGDSDGGGRDGGRDGGRGEPRIPGDRIRGREPDAAPDAAGRVNEAIAERRAADRVERQMGQRRLTRLANRRGTPEETARRDPREAAPFDVEPGVDVALEGGSVGVTPAFEREVAEAELEEYGLEPGEDVELTRVRDEPLERAADEFGGGSLVVTPVDEPPTIDEDAPALEEYALEDEGESVQAPAPTLDDAERETPISGTRSPDAPDPAGLEEYDLVDRAAEFEDDLADAPGAGAAASAFSGGVEAASGLYYGVTDRVPFSEPVVDAARGARQYTTERIQAGASGFDELAETAEREIPVVGDEIGGLASLQGGGIEAVGKAGAAIVPGGPATAAETAGALEAGAGFAGEQIGERGAVRGTEAIGGTAAIAATKAADRGLEAFTQQPYRTTGQALGTIGAAAAGGVAAGRLTGKAARGVSDRLRTAGAEKIDPEDMTNRDVLEAVERGENEFPGADDPELYRSRPAEAVRRQADENTPDAIREQLDEATGDEAADLKKALDQKPDGLRGFSTQKGSYESPGAFVGPELSTYFLGASREAGFSLRPGLPDLGTRPTAAVIRTQVDEPDAETLDDFADEMLERAGETTARTKPRSEVNPGEIEAVIPPESSFVDAGSGPIRNTLRRLGIGADFEAEYGGRRVPIRTVADPELVDDRGTPGLRAFFDDERAQFGARTAGSRVRRSLSRSSSRPVDRPLPVGPVPSSSSSSSSRREAERDLYSTGSTRRVDERGAGPVTEGANPSRADENPRAERGESGSSPRPAGSPGSSGGSSGSSTSSGSRTSTGSSTGSSSGGGGGGGGSGGSGAYLGVPTGRGLRSPLPDDEESEDVEPLFVFEDTGESWLTPPDSASEVAEELEDDLEAIVEPRGGGRA